MTIFEKIRTMVDNFYKAANIADAKFLRNYQEYGYRTDYSYAFAGSGWDDESFNLPYPLENVANANSAFYNSLIKSVTIDLDPECAGFVATFFNCRNLEEVTIEGGCLTNLSNAFYICRKLHYLDIRAVIYADINLQWSTNLTSQSLDSIANALIDLKAIDEAGTKTITLSKESLDLMSESGSLQMLDDKGWNY